MRSHRVWILALAPLVVSGRFALGQQVRLLGANDLGMHCMDKEYSVF